MISRSAAFILAIATILMLSGSMNAADDRKVVVYPAPEGVARSDQYIIEIRQGGKSYFPFVYTSEAQLPQFNKSKTTDYSIVSFTGSVEVTVTRLQGEFNECRILPSSYGLKTRKKGNSATFVLKEPRKIALEFDGDITHPLLLFADYPETDQPDPDDKSVIYFGPGVHDLDEPLAPKSGETVYIAGGAIVNGLIRAHNVSGVTVRGKGILNGRKFGHTGGRHIIFTGPGSTNITVRDITIVDSPGFYITTEGDSTSVSNIKGLGWWFNTDGIATGRNSLIEDCFLKCNDDAIKLYNSGTRVYRTTIWQMENGSPFQLSWNTNSDNEGFVVKDCDIIHCDHEWDNTNTAVFDAIHGGSGNLGNYLFEDIRIENCDWRLVSIQVIPNKFSRSTKYGSISGITFRNISINTTEGKPLKRVNLIQGYDEKSIVQEVLFENLKINGVLIGDAAAGRFEICSRTASDVSFIITGRPASKRAQPSVKRAVDSGNSIFEWTNPIRSGLNSYGLMHPQILEDGGRYYLVATEHPNLEWGKRGVILYVSDDMVNWREEAYLINRNSLRKDAWYRDVWMAPEIHSIDGRYYLTFNCRNQELDPYGRLGTGMAVADRIEGPYRVITEEGPLTYGTNFTIFSEDGKTRGFWDRDGRVYSAMIDPTSARLISPEMEVLGPSTMGGRYRFVDSPSVFKRENLYYIVFTQFYAGYIIRVQYMVADSPEGPWRFITDEPIYTFYESEAEMDLKMPWSKSHPFAPPTQVIFQHSFFIGPGGGYYNAWHTSEKYSEPYLVIEPVRFGEDGSIQIPDPKAVNQKIEIRR
jgi:hypothetical protein